MKGQYWSIWMLLAAAFIFFSALSVVGNTTLGAFELRTANIYDKLTYVEPAPVVSEPVVSESQSAPEPPAALPPVLDTTSQRILLLGDSMLEGLSPRLAAYAKENNHKLFTVIWYSSSSKMWATSGNLEKYIAQFKPTYIFLCLGANELFIKNIAELREKYVKSIVEKLGDIPFVWIGPPNKQKDTGINDLLKKNVPSDKFFLTKGMKFSYFEDQIHPTRASAVVWMDSVVRWMPSHSKHPIKLDIPTVAKAKADVQVIVPRNKD